MKKLLAIVFVLAFAVPAALQAQNPPAKEQPKEPAKEQAKVDVSGTWDFAIETPQGTMAPATTFKQDGEKLTGTQTSPMGEVALEGTVKGVDIAFAFSIDMQGQQMTISFAGKIDGDSMSGTVEFGSFGSSTWSAKRRK